MVVFNKNPHPPPPVGNMVKKEIEYVLVSNEAKEELGKSQRSMTNVALHRPLLLSFGRTKSIIIYQETFTSPPSSLSLDLYVTFIN